MPEAIIDTNIWISALMKSTLTRPIIEAFIAGKFTPVVSPELIKELNDTLNEPEVVKLINKEEAQELIELITEKSRKIRPARKVKVCRDSGDDFLIALVIESKTPLISLDKDLLALAKEFPILPPRKFLNQLGI